MHSFMQELVLVNKAFRCFNGMAFIGIFLRGLSLGLVLRFPPPPSTAWSGLDAAVVAAK